ncbi:MAG: hypothetical protein ACKO1U_06880 [Bacteroidota bacterium]
MYKYHFSDLPKPAAASLYAEAVQSAVDRIKQIDGLVAVYSIGSVGAPGISDIDLVVVFEDATVWKEELRSGMSPFQRNLFVHAAYGTCKSLLLEGQRYTFFKPYKLLHGSDLLYGANFPEPDGEVRDQVALEYLLRFFLSMKMQKAYRQLRVRSLLLNAKGAAIDLLHLSDGDLQVRRLTDELMALRQQWFLSKSPPLKEFVRWFEELYEWFPHFMKDQFSRRPFYLPENKVYAIARNLNIQSGDRLEIVSHVRRFSLLRPITGRRYFNLLNRFSSFQLMVPVSKENIPAAIAGYFDYNLRHRLFQHAHLPGCLPLTNSLHLR